MKEGFNSDLDRLVKSGDIVDYEYAEDTVSEAYIIIFPSGKRMTVSSKSYGGNFTGLIVDAW